MPFYMGVAGHMVTLPRPPAGMEGTLVRQGGSRELAGGGTSTDITGRRRTYRLPYQRLGSATVGDFATLEAFHIGMWGPGPFMVLDPQRTNMLPLNVASSTNLFRSTELFVATVGTLTSVTTQSATALRCLRWAPGTLAAAQSVRAPDPTSEFAAPAIPSLAYVASLQARLDTGSPAANARAELRWYDATGAALSTTQGTSTALSTSAWTTLTVTATTPAGAAYVGVALQTPTTGVAPLFLTDAWQLQLGSVATTWVPGTGVPRVTVDQMPDTYPRLGQHDVVMTLIEN